MYRGTSLTRKRTHLRPCSRRPMVLVRSFGGGGGSDEPGTPVHEVYRGYSKVRSHVARWVVLGR